jgi:hypothetical protein
MKNQVIKYYSIDKKEKSRLHFHFVFSIFKNRKIRYSHVRMIKTMSHKNLLKSNFLLGPKLFLNIRFCFFKNEKNQKL